MSWFAQKINGLQKRWRSFRYGISYLREADFSIPAVMKVNGRHTALHFNNTADPAFLYEFTEICINDCYQLQSLQKKLGRVQYIADIGANQGLFVLAARQRFASASISCYEPNRQLEHLLGHNANLLNAAVYYEAVARQDSTMHLQFGDSDLHTIALPGNGGNITGTAFSKIIERAGGSIDILKMDCEGGEWDLLADEASWTHIRAVTMEYHLWAKPGSTAGDVATILEKLGFSIVKENRLSDQFGLITAIKKK